MTLIISFSFIAFFAHETKFKRINVGILGLSIGSIFCQKVTFPRSSSSSSSGRLLCRDIPSLFIPGSHQAFPNKSQHEKVESSCTSTHWLDVYHHRHRPLSTEQKCLGTPVYLMTAMMFIAETLNFDKKFIRFIYREPFIKYKCLVKI